MVGFFDSGVGGTCVLEAFRRLCPEEPTVYVADTENCPYGNKPPEEIVRLSKRIAADLIERGCEVVVLKLGLPGGSVVKNPPANARGQVRPLSQEDPLE